MAKKKKQQSSSSSSEPSASSTTSATLSTSAGVPATAPLTGEAGEIERAYVLGNFSRVRELAATASTDAGRSAARRVMDTIKVEREQLFVGVGGLIVVTIVAVMTLH